ncbi:TonB-dependent receptor [Hephaestia sp. GCM10023244]|uniref:TonB-dependent receptor n=1 Tax=unclassified Hephaestia TaxID=2631281 RepID=UPI0020770CC4|nr:TonB-dependent receptor [Hephaestia sp. MAHUQ-44]MCM8729362.1 TonB-dependent receptor [Hephaestia sp. MAHUQ-44]
MRLRLRLRGAQQRTARIAGLMGLGGVSMLSLAAVPALAEEVAAPDAPAAAGPVQNAVQSTAPTVASDSGPADIIVTAQKREERLQDVPISIAVIGGEALTALNFNEATDLQYLVPGVQVLNAAGPRSFGFYIRGVGTTSFSSESVEGSVAYVVDGVVLGQSGASLSDLPDIERIEVLRGPQGTLFGKNASAGVVNVVTRDPSDHWETRITGSLAWPKNERKLSGLVTGPISDKIGILVSGRMNKRDGLVTNVFDGRKFNDRNDYGFRGKIKGDFDNLTTTVIGDWWRRRADCCIWTLRSVGPTPNALEQSQLAAGIVPSPKNSKQNVNGDVRSNIDSWGVSLNNDLDVGGDYTVSSITAFRQWHTIDGLDTDSRPTNIYDQNFADFRQKQFTQELRLTSPTGGLIDYVVGLYYFHSDVTSVSFQDNRGSAAAFAARAVTNDATTDNYAVFGQANINLTPKFRLITGARWLSETAFASKYRVDTRTPTLTSFDRQKKTDTGFVWRLGAQYDLNPDANVFATVTRGFKAGGWDTGIGFPELTEVNPEIPTSMEAGIRTSWPSAGLTFNVTAFHLIVEDYQISARVPGALSIYRLINAAKLQSDGVEVDFTWRPIGDVDFTLSGGASWMDAKFKRFDNAQCYSGQTAATGCDPATGTQDLSGSVLPRAPKFSWNVMANYATDISSDLRLHIDFDANYRSRTAQGFPISPLFYQNRYALLNGAIGIAGDGDRWRLSVFGRNLADKYFANNISATVLGSGAGSTQQYPIYESRRVIGVGFDVRF